MNAFSLASVRPFFFSLLLASIPACASAPDEAARTEQSASTASCTATRAGLMGINLGGGDPGTVVARLNEVGIKRVRLEVQLRKSGEDEAKLPDLSDTLFWKARREAEYARLDPLVLALRGAGIRVLLTIDYMAAAHYKMYALDFEEWTRLYVPFYANQVDQIVAHYSDTDDAAQNPDMKDAVDVFELWNEPDAAGALDVSLFTPLLKAGIAAARAHTKTATVISGVASVGYWRRAVDTGKGGDPAVVAGLTAINLHPYNTWPAATNAAAPNDQKGSFPPGAPSLAETLANIAPIANGRPIWFSEFGDQASPSDAQNAEYITAFYRFFAHPPAGYEALAAQVHEAYLYNFNDYAYAHGGVLVHVTMGIFEADGKTRKPLSWAAMHAGVNDSAFHTCH